MCARYSVSARSVDGEGERGVLTQRHRDTEGMTAADLPIVSCTSHIAISDVGGVCGGDGG